MLSRTGEYALRAMIHLARNADQWPIPGKSIAEETGIPPKYLSKILGDLVRVGILDSLRGKNGGFRMLRSPKKVPLIDVLLPFEPLARRRCPFGNQMCSEKNPCRAHHKWNKVVEVQQGFLQKTSVFDVAFERGERSGGKKRKKRR